MALTSTTTLDIVNQTQTITFFEASTQVDQIVYSANAITWETSTGYNLSKADLLLYFQYLNAFNNLLLINFPTFAPNVFLGLPLSSFNITLSTQGVEHITYAQTSLGTTVVSINYVPAAASGSFATRSSPVTITAQEWLLSVILFPKYSFQISLN